MPFAKDGFVLYGSHDIAWNKNGLAFYGSRDISSDILSDTFFLPRVKETKGIFKVTTHLKMKKDGKQDAFHLSILDIRKNVIRLMRLTSSRLPLC